MRLSKKSELCVLHIKNYFKCLRIEPELLSLPVVNGKDPHTILQNLGCLQQAISDRWHVAMYADSK